MMPLTMLNVGEVGTIRKIGGNDETKRFLNNLGFVIGTKITVLSAISGNVIVNVKDSRIAINQDMARHIMIWCPSKLRVPYTGEPAGYEMLVWYVMRKGDKKWL